MDLPELPEPDELWHPIARDWYLSLRESGRALDTGLFYDSLEAPAEALLTEEWIVPTLEAVRGDSTWL
ncbi:hypothetical protein KBZ21_39975, partial [Streptomyces sp. A73]|nr:hypothetical protein [Streptomyces sp. A73]